MKNRIALDVDGTLAETNAHWIKLFDYSFKKEDIDDWDVWVKLGLSLTKFLTETRLVWENHWEEIPLIDEGYKSIDCLDMPVDIVTARPQPIEIRKWLKLHEIPYEKLIVMPSSKQKHLTGHQVYIDDAPTMRESLYGDQFQILIDSPWNQHIHQDFKILRAKSFDDVVQIIESQSELGFYNLTKNGIKWC